MVIDDDFGVVSGNVAFYEMFQLQHSSVVGKTIGEVGDGRWDTATLCELLENIRLDSEAIHDLVLEAQLPDGGSCKLVFNVRPLEQAITLPGKILVTMFPMAE